MGRIKLKYLIADYFKSLFEQKKRRDTQNQLRLPMPDRGAKFEHDIL
jgi:hypothetical protein